MTHRVLLGQGDQTIRYVPIDALGRPTRVASATYTIVDLTEGSTSSNRTVVASTAATVDAVSTILTAAAGRTASNSRLLSIDSTSGILSGHSYLLATADGDGHRELVTAERVATGAVHALREVQGIYATSDTLQGIELSATFPAAVADDEDLAIRDRRDYQIVWSFEINSRAYLVPERITVERYSVVPWIGPEDVLRGHPMLKSRLRPGSEHDALAVATEEIEGELEASGINPAYYRPSTVGRIAVRYLALDYLFRQVGGGEADQTLAETYRARFKTQILQLIANAPPDARIVSRQNDTSHAVGDYTNILVPS